MQKSLMSCRAIMQMSKPSQQAIQFTGEQTGIQHEPSCLGNVGHTCTARIISFSFSGHSFETLMAAVTNEFLKRFVSHLGRLSLRPDRSSLKASDGEWLWSARFGSAFFKGPICKIPNLSNTDALGREFSSPPTKSVSI